MRFCLVISEKHYFGSMYIMALYKHDHFTSLKHDFANARCCGHRLPKEEILLDFAGQAVRPDKLKDDSKNVNGQINVSCLFH